MRRSVDESRDDADVENIARGISTTRGRRDTARDATRASSTCAAPSVFANERTRRDTARAHSNLWIRMVVCMVTLRYM